MSPQRPPHAGTIGRSDRILQHLLGDSATQTLRERAIVRIQLPIALSTSEPEPDIAIVRRDPREYGNFHPMKDDIYGLMEVDRTTLTFDRDRNSLIYAKAGIPEYWILNIDHRQAYIYTHPTETDYGTEVKVGKPNEEKS